MNASFVHLHLHTEFSLTDGLVRVKPLVEAVARLGMPAVAITDRNNLFAMVKFYRAALSAGVKPIVGMEVLVHHDGAEQLPAALVLLAQNTSGYKNLSQLTSRSYLQGRRYQGQAVLDASWLNDANDGLIALSGGRLGEVGQLLSTQRFEEAQARLQFWRKVFPNRYYLELQRTGRTGEEDYLDAAVSLAHQCSVPVVASNDVRFIELNDYEAHETRVCIQEGYTLDNPSRPRECSNQQYLRSATEMVSLFADLPEALENSVVIARRCNLQLELGRNYLPAFPVPSGMTLDQLLECESQRGLERRLQHAMTASNGGTEIDRDLYAQRLQTEIEVITQMGFAGYFLIVADFIRWARTNKVPVGPGRGSGAGSLVAYALQITDIDPITYDLLFERFLNPERVSMPDFDIDFCMEGRDRVIEYVAQKYGRDRVAQIATHGTMAAKAVVRDVGRVMGHPYGFVDRIAKLIPFEVGMTLAKALEQELDLRQVYEDEEEVHSIIDMGRALEGLARNVGKHAGGVVIAPTALTNFSPLYCEEGSAAAVTQLDKDDVEAVGLVKFDFLGLRTLTIIDWAVATINQNKSSDPVEIADIPLDDGRTFDLLKAHATTGVFQLESRGMKDLIKRLQPDGFDDIVALVALFRPGPLQSGMVDDFIDRKHGRAAVTYPHPDLEPILCSTYGVILYQEQVMQIAQVLAGYTLGGADMLRRAMGKKKPEEMAKQRTVFVDGAVTRGVERDTAAYIFDLMEKFAGYGFNKSHSAAYALVSYQTAWLKAHYPAAFMAAVLSSDMDNTDKVVAFIDECRQLRLTVVPPAVNASEFRFTVADDRTIIYGLGAVKGIGEAAIELIVQERLDNGEYRDIYDLCRRLDPRRVNRRVLEALIRSGALDCLQVHRAQFMHELPDAIRLADQSLQNSAAGQSDMFGLDIGASESGETIKPAASVVPEWDESRRLAEEKDTLGLYLTGHPVDAYTEELATYTSGRLTKVINETATGRSPNSGWNGQAGTPIVAAGLIVELRSRISQRGSRMRFVTLDDGSARLEARLFGEVAERFGERLRLDSIVVIEGKLVFDTFADALRLNVERVMDLETARGSFARGLGVQLCALDFTSGLLERLHDTMRQYLDGNCRVIVDYRNECARAQVLLGESWRVVPTDDLLMRLRELLGKDRVSLLF